MTKTNSRFLGFTFIEMLVVLGIIALISAVSAQVFLTSSKNATKSDLIRNIKQNGELALEIMTRMVQNAKSISSPCSGAPLATLSLVGPDAETTTFGCVADGDSARIASQSALTTAYLTTSNLTLGGTTCADSTLSFVCSSQAGLTTSVTINFTLSQVGQAAKTYQEASVPFQTSVTVRSYSDQ